MLGGTPGGKQGGRVDAFSTRSDGGCRADLSAGGKLFRIIASSVVAPSLEKGGGKSRDCWDVSFAKGNGATSIRGEVLERRGGNACKEEGKVFFRIV